jgi:WD40 repeat protein
MSGWAFESAVERVLGRALSTALALWDRNRRLRLAAYAGAGAMAVASALVVGIPAYENRHERMLVPPGAFELSPHGRYFSVYVAEGIEVWSVDERRRVDFVEAEHPVIETISPDGRLLASWACHSYPCEPLEYIRVVSVRNDSTIKTLQASDAGFGQPEWSPDGSLLAAATSEGVEIFQVREGKRSRTIKVHGPLLDGPGMLTWSPDSSLLATREEAQRISLWDVKSGRLVSEIPSRPDEISDHDEVSFDPDGYLFAEAGAPVRLWNVRSGRIVRTLDGNEVAATALAFSPDGGLLATGGEDGRVRLWRVNDGELLKTYSMHRYRGYPSSVDVIEFSPDGRRIVSYSSKEAVRIWPVEKDVRELGGEA